MKAKVVLLVMFLVLWAVCVPAQTYSPPTVKYVSVDAPGSGETVEGNKDYMITWDSSSDIEVVSIYYTLDGDEWSILVSCTNNNKRYRWRVQQTNTNGARIKVLALDDCINANVVAEDSSGRFTISSKGMDPCSCISCSDCSDKLKSSACSTVYLGRDITSGSGQCVSFSANRKTFDCQGHRIAGGAVDQEFYYGIFAVNSNEVTITNCEISDFEVGVEVTKSKTVRIEDCKIRNNRIGVLLSEADESEIRNNVIENNDNGISLRSARGTVIRQNRICRSSVADIFTSPESGASGTTRDANVCDLIYNWNNDGGIAWCEETCTSASVTSVTTGAELQSALNGDYGKVSLGVDVSVGDGLVMNASHVTLACNGHRISGTGSDVGILVKSKADVEIKNCIISNFETGILLEGSSQNRINSNTISNNKYGLIIREGDMPARKNLVVGNQIRPNSVYAVYLNGRVEENVLENNLLGGGQYSLYTTASCNNDISPTNKGGSGEKSIAYVHSSYSSLNDQEYSELILCDVFNAIVESIRITGGATGSDGIIIRNSRNVQLRDSMVSHGYNGILVMNSTGVRLQRNSIKQSERDCISIDRSTATEVEDGSLVGCERGVYAYLSPNTRVKNVAAIKNNSISGIQFTMSYNGYVGSNIIEGGTILDTKGIVLEDSNNNTLESNTIKYTAEGVSIDSSSSSNRLIKDVICRNALDIANLGSGNSGGENTCSRYTRWSDGNLSGCESCCSPPSSDINKDGVDDACDCNDAFKGPGETGVDCGGRCGTCIKCDWCGNNVETLRVTGRPNEGMVDVVFVPHESFKDNLSNFKEDAYTYVRDYYLKLDNLTAGPLPTDFGNRFNFYIYTGGFGRDGQCAGMLPGEQEYADWLAKCSPACAMTLGLGCSCFTAEPSHFYSDAGWADAAGILTTGSAGCANALGPQSQFIAENSGPMVIRESGHAIFGLVEEYDPDPATNAIRFGEAAGKRMKFVFDSLVRGGSSRGVLIYVKHDSEGMRKVGLTVVSGHPDLGLQKPVYWTEVIASSGERMREFGLGDYRKPIASGTSSDASPLDEVVFQLNIPFEGSPRWVNVYDHTTGRLILSMDIGPELYGWCSVHQWAGEDCKTLDTDNDGIPDSMQTSAWIPQQRMKNQSFGSRPELQSEDYVPQEETSAQAEEDDMPKAEKSGGDLLSPILLLLAAAAGLAGVAAVFIIAVALVVGFILLKRRKNQKTQAVDKKGSSKPGG
jgi:parallel beta-helix repeat protein